MKSFLLALTLLAADPTVQDDLTKAEKELAEAKDKVKDLRKQYYALQITQISKVVDKFDAELPKVKKDSAAYRDLLHQKLPTLFDKERAQLALIIDEEPALADKAQAQLDRILAILTRLNSEAREETPTS